MGDDDMKMAPENRLRDWAEVGLPDRLNKKVFGQKSRNFMKIHQLFGKSHPALW
jgi:hypothetical protein